MHTLANISAPESPRFLPLFFGLARGSGDETSLAPSGMPVPLEQGSCLSFAGYFNVFFEEPFLRETHLRQIELQLELDGDLEVTVSRTTASGRRETVSQERKLFTPPDVWSQRFELKDLGQDTGYLHFSLRALGEKGLFRAGRWATCEEGREDIHLGVVVCTHRREEALQRLVCNLRESSLLASQPWSLLVVDNSNQLAADSFRELGCRVVAQQNCGGAGGFTRGILETLQGTDPRATHVLLMDDDIEILPETLHRSIQFLRYQTTVAVVGSPLFDLHDPCTIDVSGETFGLGKSALSPRSMLGRFAPVGQKLPMACRVGSSDWTGWWFSIFPREVLEKDLPLPVFVRGDDIEFGLRLKKKAVASRYIPGWAIWHEPFGSPQARVPEWIHYYNTRNGLAHRALHGDAVDAKLLAWQIFHQQFNHYAYTFQYGVAELLLDGAEDFLRGPQALLADIPRGKHERVVASSSRCAPDKLETAIGDGIPKVPWWLLLAGVLTHHGHSLPRFLSRRPPLALHKSELRRRHSFGREAFVLLGRDGAARYMRRREEFFPLLRRRDCLRRKFLEDFDQAAEMWRSGCSALQSRSTWESIFAKSTAAEQPPNRSR